MNKHNLYSGIAEELASSYKISRSVKLSTIIKSVGLSLILSVNLVTLNACTNEIFINQIIGERTLAAPPNNDNSTDGDGDNMNGGDGNSTDGDGGNSTDGDNMDGDGNSTDGDDDNMNGGDGNSTDGDDDNMNGGDGNSTDGDDGRDNPGPDGDLDGDGVINSLDVDDDGDGLIEISSIQEFDLMRWDLEGRSLAGVFTGCGDNPDLVATACIGYELIDDITLGTFSNWEPIGSCDDVDLCLLNRAFRGTFEGNNHVIIGIRLEPQSPTYGLGLFGSIANANLRNFRIRSFQITPITESSYVGIIGTASDSVIHNIQVDNLIINNDRSTDLVDEVGGLVGKASFTTITNSSVRGNIYVGVYATLTANHIGGLVGSCYDTTIKSSATQLVGLVAKAYFIGGLFGRCLDSEILGSSSQISSVVSEEGSSLNTWYVGGLGGLAGADSLIVGSYSNVFNFDIRSQSITVAGGLIGSISDTSTATSSYSVASYFYKDPEIPSDNTFGGFFGSRGSNSIISNSYWDIRARFDVAENKAVPYGERATVEMQSPIIFPTSTLYRTWADLWCDPLTLDIITSISQPPGYIRLWDLGTTNEYPALNCSPFSLEIQRDSTSRVFNLMTPY